MPVRLSTGAADFEARFRSLLDLKRETAADVDAAVEVALGHGGVAEVPAADTPLGRVAVLRGPSRERFALLDATEED